MLSFRRCNGETPPEVARAEKNSLATSAQRSFPVAESTALSAPSFAP